MNKNFATSLALQDDKPSADEIFYQIEAECPEDMSNLMVGGRRITPHGNWHDENGW